MFVCSCFFLFFVPGLLGLPVTIAHAGLVPFLISFLIGYFVQVSDIRLILFGQIIYLQHCSKLEQ